MITYLADKNKTTKDPSHYVKVPFKEATSLISRRQVFLYKGLAYVPIKELNSIASAHFKARLNNELITAYKNLP